MFGSAFLDTIIAVCLTFAAASAACSGIFEAFSSLIGLRGVFLKKTLYAMFAKREADAILQHPAIQALSTRKWRSPSYIDPVLLARVVYTLFVTNNNGVIKSNLAALRPLCVTANSPSGAVTQIAEWFSACTDRTSGLYRRWSQFGLSVVAIPICYFLPLDAIAVAKTLYLNSGFRQQILAKAASATDATTGLVDLSKLVYPAKFGLGEILAMLAISLGAPFWFDLAKNLLRLNPRQSGPAPDSLISGQ